MISLIVFLPLIGALFAGFSGERFGKEAPEIVTSSLLTLTAFLSWIVFFKFAAGGEPFLIFIASWITSGTFQADWMLRIDILTVIMLVVVTTVSSLVHWYSIGYMHTDPHRSRFFSYLSFFTFAMLILVTSDNLLQMFFGWEGVGLASYLLIGFWYQRPRANAAAMKAFLVNRVGDFGFALGILGIFVLFGAVDFESIFNGSRSIGNFFEGKSQEILPFYDLLHIDFLFWKIDTVTLICLLLFMGAMGKSAQFFLHTWLPDAMEGPTPVSALIHAATMVTAGIFMVARLSPLFVLSPFAMTVITVIGATTAFFAATVALVQNDIKRVIAYSTCSQLGYMFAALGVGAFSVGVFHLFTHAFFKALLFLGAGSVIHAVSEEQDMNKMGGLCSYIPKTYLMMLIGTFALTGFPLTSGYFSKDAIIEATYAASFHSSAGFYAFLMTSMAALLTSFYSWRLIFLTFHGTSHISSEIKEHIHESPMIMLVPLFILAFASLFFGFIFKSFFIGKNYDHFFGNSVFPSSGTAVLDAMHHVPFWVIWTPTLAMISGFIFALLLYLKWPNFPSRLAEQNIFLYKFLLNKWYFDDLYHFFFVRPIIWLGNFFWKRGDTFLIDGFGPDAVAARTLDLSRIFSRFQTGYLYHYAFIMLIGLTFLMTFCIWRILG